MFNETAETRIDLLRNKNIKLLAAPEEAELSCTRARLANGIGKPSKAKQISFLLNSFDQLAKEARAAITEAKESHNGTR